MMGPTRVDVQVLVSPDLPIYPSHREDARRIVRHGMAEILDWLGENVGPRPGEPQHMVLGMDPASNGGVVAFVSAEMRERIVSVQLVSQQDGAS